MDDNSARGLLRSGNLTALALVSLLSEGDAFHLTLAQCPFNGRLCTTMAHQDAMFMMATIHTSQPQDFGTLSSQRDAARYLRQPLVTHSWLRRQKRPVLQASSES